MVYISSTRREEALENWLLLFLTFSIAGWAWEVLLTFGTTGQWVNRGLLHGPWLPVYGAGGILLAVALGNLKKTGVSVLLLSAAVGGAVEYAAAWALETLYRQRWWDYSGYAGSIHGRICLMSLTGFALAGWLTARAAPKLLLWFSQAPSGMRRLACRSMSLVFALDWAFSLIRPNAGTGISTPL